MLVSLFKFPLFKLKLCVCVKTFKFLLGTRTKEQSIIHVQDKRQEVCCYTHFLWRSCKWFPPWDHRLLGLVNRYHFVLHPLFCIWLKRSPSLISMWWWLDRSKRSVLYPRLCSLRSSLGDIMWSPFLFSACVVVPRVTKIWKTNIHPKKNLIKPN